jgi:hypothetical protein
LGDFLKIRHILKLRPHRLSGVAMFGLPWPTDHLNGRPGTKYIIALYSHLARKFRSQKPVL